MKNKQLAQISGDITSYREFLQEYSPSLVDETIAIVGTAVKGPAFIPQTVGQFDKSIDNLDTWEDIFGDFSSQEKDYGPLLSNIWLSQNSQLTYCRVLGIGDGLGLNEDSRYEDAGFVVGDSPISGSVEKYYKSANSYSVENGDPGRTHFLGKYVKDIDLQEYISPYESYIEQITGDNTVNRLGLVTDVIFAASGSRLLLQKDETEAYKEKNVIESLSENNNTVSIDYGTTITTLKYPQIYVQGLKDKSKVLIDFEKPSNNFKHNHIKTNTLNDNSDYYLYRGHYRYCTFPDTETLQDVDILEVEGEIVEENKNFILTSSSDWNTDDNSPNFESFESIYTRAKTPWVISQPIERSILSDVDKSSLSNSRFVKLFRFHTYTDGVSGNEYRFRIKPKRLGDQDLEDVEEKWSRFDVIVYKYDKNNYDFTELFYYNSLNLNPASENYIGKVIGTQHEHYDLNKKKIIKSGNYLKTNQHIYVEINSEIEFHNTDCSLIPCGFMSYPRININNQNLSIENSDTMHVANPIRMVGNLLVSKDEEENFYIKNNPYWGVLFDKTKLVKINEEAYDGSKIKLCFDMHIPNNKTKCAFYEYTKYFQDFKETKAWVDDETSVNNSFFHLEKILYMPNNQSLSESWKYAFYRRDGKSISDLTSNQEKQQTISNLYKYVNIEEVLKSETLSDADSAVYLSFDFFTYGGFDGVNKLDMHKKKMDKVSVLREENNEVPTKSKGQSLFAYEIATNNVLDNDFYRKDIFCIPGIQSEFLNRKILQKTEEAGSFIYVFDIEEYDKDNNLIYEDYYFKNIENKSSEIFDERFFIKRSSIEGSNFTYLNFESKFFKSKYAVAAYNLCEASIIETNTQVVVPPSLSYLLYYSNTNNIAQPVEKANLDNSSVLRLNAPLNSKMLYQNNYFDKDLFDLKKYHINSLGTISTNRQIKPLSSKTLLKENTNLFNLNHNVRILLDIKRNLEISMITSDEFLFNNFSLNNPINNLKFNAESFLSDIMQGYLDDNIIKNYNVNLKIQDKSKSQREALDHKISGEVSFSLFGNDNVFNNIAIDINNLLENINKNSYESNITITNI